jgi:hypothetical protein
MNTYDEPNEKRQHKCYVLRNLLYVPSYIERGIFVGLTSRKYQEQQLIDAGAKEKFEFLWVRSFAKD